MNKSVIWWVRFVAVFLLLVAGVGYFQFTASLKSSQNILESSTKLATASLSEKLIGNITAQIESDALGSTIIATSDYNDIREQLNTIEALFPISVSRIYLLTPPKTVSRIPDRWPELWKPFPGFEPGIVYLYQAVTSDTFNVNDPESYPAVALDVTSITKLIEVKSGKVSEGVTGITYSTRAREYRITGYATVYSENGYVLGYLAIELSLWKIMAQVFQSTVQIILIALLITTHLMSPKKKA